LTRHGVPAALWELQTTFRVPSGISPAHVVADIDGYQNDNPPPVSAVHGKVAMAEPNGWRLTADVTVPFGDPPFPMLVYLHGGGWVEGAPWTHRRLAAELAARGLLVINVDYRRAPKHRFPGAFEDACFAVDWAAGHGAQFGGDPRRLLIGGDSAGANLAAAVLACGTRTPVAGALLCYGIFDFHRALPVMGELIGGITAPTQLYLPPAEFDALREDPRLSPQYHVGDFPPTLLTVGELDPLRGESETMAAALQQACVPHQLHLAADAPHGYLQMPGHPAYDTGYDALAAFARDTRGSARTRRSHKHD
jgi:acetyl esterase